MPVKAIAAATMPKMITSVSPKRLTAGPTRKAWQMAKPMPKAPSERPICDEVKLKTSMVK